MRFVILLVLLTGCGSFRGSGGGHRGGGGYRGIGEFRTGSDYGPDGQLLEDTGPNPYGSSAINPPVREYIPSADFRLFWPVSRIKLNRGFRPETDPNHQGIDLGGERGSTIQAAHEGVVIYAGSDFKGYGKMVLIEYNKEWATLYGHMDKLVTREGTIVRPGDPIGTMGRTGRASGVHLHFELIQDRQPIDPLKYLSHGQQYTKPRKRLSGREVTYQKEAR